MLVPSGTMVMVVDGARMSLYRSNGSADSPNLALFDNQCDPAPHTAELGSDRPGRRFESMGTSRGAYEGPDYHQQEEDHFAVGAADRLNELAAQGDKLILVAAPHVLGVMRKHIDEAARRLLLAQIDKDFAGKPAEDVAKLLIRHDA